MKSQSRKLFTGFAVAAFFAITLAALARDPGDPASGPELRRIDQPPASSVPPAPPAPAAAPAPAPDPATATPTTSASDDDSDQDVVKPRHRRASPDSDDRVSVLSGDLRVGSDETLNGNVVCVMANVTVDGTVDGNSVAVMGNNTINGTVRGNAVAVMGNLTLGPRARVDGQLVCIGGQIVREKGSSVGGRIVQKEVGGRLGIPLTQWWRHGLSHGAPLAWGPHLGWLWILNAFLLVIYILMALVFPGGIQKCGNTLRQRPVVTIFSAFLVVLSLPILFILLLITIVGIPVALVLLPLALIVGVMFGRASIYALVGHALSGNRLNPALAVLLGSVVFLLLYLVPFVGLALSLCVAFVGLGCVVATLFASVSPPPKPAVAAPVSPHVTSPVVGVPPVVLASPVPAVAEAGVSPGISPTPPPLLTGPAPVVTESNVGLPRAGFWIRMVALLIDTILISVVCLGHPPFILLGLALYGALLWKHRGSTIGGIILGLKVLRVDDRPIDWGTAFVRAFSCFFSLVVVGFGFLWIAFDGEKQAWHDKIAGTVVVRSPKGVTLI